jgi:RNA polymerase sigma-70 factor (ECF subfamily)
MPATLKGQTVSLEAAQRLLERASPPAEWKLTPEQFQTALERSVKRRFSENPPDAKDVETYLATLHISDLALACACSAGNDMAWDHFVAQFRPELHRAARAVAGEANSRELADSLYAELYGLRESGGVRNSLFDYFHGRSRLTTWLRAILAQRHVDWVRRSRRTDSLDDAPNVGDSVEFEMAASKQRETAMGSSDPERRNYLAILQAALEAALSALGPQERLRLAYYYADGLTLAQIGKLLREHEATVSRKLERTRRELRQRIDAALRERKLSAAQVQLCYEYAKQEWPFDLTRHLRAEPSGAAEEQGGFPVSEVD